MNSYDKGDQIRVTGTFTNAARTAIDPDDVFFKKITPSGTATTYEYGEDAELERSAKGIYHVDVDIDTPGTWYFRMHSTGSGKAAREAQVSVKNSRF